MNTNTSICLIHKFQNRVVMITIQTCKTTFLAGMSFWTEAQPRRGPRGATDSLECVKLQVDNTWCKIRFKKDLWF